ncbi:UNVERIFIED_CONTAM: hypothetical protein GTU68_049830 [Idotea baltica]|nr:hypothetical protein [Idotea baltica]
MVEEAESTFGPIYMLVNCAGFAKAAKFEDVSEAACRSMMDVNFLGSFFLTQEVVRRMKSADVGGIIVFVSSAGGLFGVFGYTAYAAAKGALVKFAEALHMELKPYDISVTVNYPPDTDTPGFAEENKTKPVETGLISESAGLFKTEDVAKALIEDSLHGKFSSSVGLEGFMLATMCAGMSPVTDLFSVVSQIFLSGVFRFVSLFYLWNFARIVSAEREKRLLSKKEE